MAMMNNVLKMKENLFTKLFVNKYLIYVFATIILILTTLQGSGLMFEDSYFFDRTSDILLNNWDELSFGGRSFDYPVGGIFITYLLKSFLNLQNIFDYLPIVLGLLSLFLLRKIYSHYDENKFNKSLFSYLLIISPPFLFTFANYVTETFTLFLSILGVYFYLKKYKKTAIFSIFLLTFFGFFYSWLSFLIIIILCFEDKSRYFFYFIFLEIVYYSVFFYNHGFPVFLKYNTNFLKDYLFEFGSAYGITFFILILSFFGIMHLWKSKYKYYKIYLSFILLVLASIIYSRSIVFLNLLLCFLGTNGFVFFINEKWEGKQLKFLTILILSLGLIFSGFSYVNFNNESKEMINALGSIEENSVVFSHFRYGVYINYFAKSKNVLDVNFCCIDNVNEIYEDSQLFIKSRKADTTIDIVNKYEIGYVLITPWMKKNLGLSNEEGLLFVLKYSEQFEKVYDKDGFEVWKIKKL